MCPNIDHVYYLLQLIILFGILALIAPPLGALLLKNIKKEKAKKTIGTISIMLGIVSLLRAGLLLFNL